MDALANDIYRQMILDCTKDRSINMLFSRIPESSIYAYKKTLNFKANKEYAKSGGLLPNNLFALIDTSIKEKGVLRTYKDHAKEFEKLEKFFNIDKLYLVNILKGLQNEDSQSRYKAVESIKYLIRTYNSQYKGHFLKLYNKEKMDYIKSISTKKNKSSIDIKDIKVDYSFRDFLNEMKQNDPSFYVEFLNKMEDASNIFIDDIYDDVVSAIDNHADIKEFIKLFGIYEPINYDENYIKKKKTIHRLQSNFEPLFNTPDNSIEYKELIVKYINGLVNNNLDKSLIKEIKTKDKINIDTCYKALKKVEGKAILENNSIRFTSPLSFNHETASRNKYYEMQLGKIKDLLAFANKYYKKEKQLMIETQTIKHEIEYSSDVVFDDENYEINKSSYIDENLIRNLIYCINKRKVHDLTPHELDSLNCLLNNEHLLFSYLIGNITPDEILSIINNYSSILFQLKKDYVTIDDLEEILRISKTFRYVNDIDIALIGYDNLVKIINYNQFAGTEVTDETIKLRVHKASYLVAKSELQNKSSLPFDISVKKGGLILDRYLNNDPDVLVSGIETKTCFFISVNENDFFFYSLLNKNGFVLKITDEEGNFIARASCFRRNNALMINGIRLKNNEIMPRNKEQKDMMDKIVNLIEMMSEKIIYSTSGDECPIDYVLCNKAGILENNEYDNRYEMVDFKLIREAIDIYNDDWKEFLKINEHDNTLLQEAPFSPETSFTTDFGDNYPLVLIRSRNNMGLLKPSDISLKTQNDIYIRPKKPTHVYTADEIDDELLERINRTRALYTLIGSTRKKQRNFKLIKNTDKISTVVIADDWIGIVWLDGTKEFAYTNYQNLDYLELQKYASFRRVNIYNNKVKEYTLKHSKRSDN